MSIATVERSHATFHIKRGLRFSHCYFIRAVHSALEKVAFAPVKFLRCFGRCFRLVFRLALCARTVYAVVHKSFALSALHGFHRARAHRSARYTRSDTAPTFGVHVRGAIPDACPRNAVRGGYDYSQGGHRSDCPRVPRRCPAVLGCTPLECLHYSAGVPPCQPLFQKNFSSCFFSKIMKTHAHVVVLKTGENRRKHRF